MRNTYAQPTPDEMTSQDSPAAVIHHTLPDQPGSNDDSARWFQGLNPFEQKEP